jgi:ADP-ribosyl-[dinitrogen reductase] hydrolase
MALRSLLDSVRETFDVGNTTQYAISRLKKGAKPDEAGGKSEYSNGNGSLMRILPLAYYLENTEPPQKFEIIQQVSSITHAHTRSQMVCGIYIELAINLLKGDTPKSAYKNVTATILDFYGREPYRTELDNFSRILQADISKLTEEEIKSSGYVIDTLEAGLWCLLTNNSYAEAVLNAVNLGGDTDTTGAVTGGLAGIYYGYENIPKDWVEQIARKEDIMELAIRLNKKIYGNIL